MAVSVRSSYVDRRRADYDLPGQIDGSRRENRGRRHVAAHPDLKLHHVVCTLSAPRSRDTCTAVKSKPIRIVLIEKMIMNSIIVKASFAFMPAPRDLVLVRTDQLIIGAVAKQPVDSRIDRVFDRPYRTIAEKKVAGLRMVAREPAGELAGPGAVLG